MNEAFEKELDAIKVAYIVAASKVPKATRRKIVEMMNTGSTAGEARAAVCPDLDYGVVAQIILEEFRYLDT